MTDPTYHLAGEIHGASTAAIRASLAGIDDLRVDSGEVKIESSRYSLSIYPSGSTTDGSQDFLVGGNLWVPQRDSVDIVRGIAERLDRGGIQFSFELTQENGDAEWIEMFTSTGGAEGADASDRPRTVDGGRIVIGDRLDEGSVDEVRRGALASDPSTAVRITLTGRHPESHLAMRARLALPYAGIAPLEFLGAPDAGVPYDDALAERVTGASAIDCERLSAAAVARIGADVARVLSLVHADGVVLAGVRPELIYVTDTAPRFTVLAPRGPGFAASAPQPAGGTRSFLPPYLSPEELGHQPATAASDVFALAASLWRLATGAHPFGEPERMGELLANAMSGRPTAWLGPLELGEVLRRALAVRPSERPGAAELASELVRVS